MDKIMYCLGFLRGSMLHKAGNGIQMTWEFVWFFAVKEVFLWEIEWR